MPDNAQMSSFPDRLAEAVRGKGNPLCVGIDPRWESLPQLLRAKHNDGSLRGVARAFEEFGLRVLDLVAPVVPVIKPQAAFFEACGPDGFIALRKILHRARELGLITILDAKRGDIASTASAYADAAFAGITIDERLNPVWDADSLTVNPYLGRDAMEPFIESARRAQRGLFVLVRTSNPGAGLFQDLDCGGRPLYEHIAQAVGAWNQENLGQCGLGDVGAVVGATHPVELQRLRQLLPNVWFLVPGYGTQGGTAADVAGAFRNDGLGAIINSSRGITFPFQPSDPHWERAIANATAQTIEALKKTSPLG
jgi:orotidine-5'-phosphate decarboxylase